MEARNGQWGRGNILLKTQVEEIIIGGIPIPIIGILARLHAKRGGWPEYNHHPSVFTSHPLFCLVGGWVGAVGFFFLGAGGLVVLLIATGALLLITYSL